MPEWKVEPNRSLWPFLAAAAVTSAALCAALGFRGWALAGMLCALFCGAFAAWLLVYVLFLLICSLLIDASRPQTAYEPFYNAMVTWVEGLLPALTRTRIHVAGAQRLPEGRWLLVGNHRSGFDPLVTGWILRRRRLAFILKPSIRRLPVVGPFVHRACFLAIDRENDREALKSILAAAKLLKAGVVSYGIYPEGTRNTGAEPLPFRNGAFKIAQKAGCGIAVAVVRDTELIRRHFPWRHTDVYVDFRAFLDAERVAAMSTAEIGEYVRETILARPAAEQNGSEVA